MKLDGYLQRIGFAAEPRVDLETLKRIHHQHMLSIPYESLDVQLRNPLDFDIQRIYQKLVVGQRGGWCYEMNGLMGWALEQIGFDVMRLTGGVMRATRGDDAMGNHLVLAIQLESTWIADVGLGDGTFEPYELKAHTFKQNGFNFRLEKLEDAWRFHNHEFSSVDSMDFYFRPADEQLFADKNAWLSTDAESPFVRCLVCHRATVNGYQSQVGRLFTQISNTGSVERTVDSANELVVTLHESFDLDLPEVASLWADVCAEHERYLKNVP